MTQLVMASEGGVTFRFETLRETGFDSDVVGGGGGWVEQGRVNQQALLYSSGRPLRTRQIKAKWVANPAARQDLLAVEAEQTPVTLVAGTGENWGRWVIDRLSIDGSRVLLDGSPQVLSVTLSLKEHVDG